MRITLVKKMRVGNRKIVSALEMKHAIEGAEELAVARFREAYRQLRESEPVEGELQIDLTLDLTGGTDEPREDS